MFGSHLSITGGMHNAILLAEKYGMGTVQVFTKNQQQWKCRPLAEEAIVDWSRERQRVGFDATVSHASYLINLASPDERLWKMSVELFAEELRRCVILGIPYLVIHPGAHVGSGEEAGLLRVADGLDLAYEMLVDKKVMTCLEVTAGQGTCLGHRLEQLAEIIRHAKNQNRLGVCLDTAHLFAAGYDFRGEKYPSFAKEVDGVIGLGQVKVWHLNDSKKELGSRVDRHEHIGRGFIGLEGFRPIVRDKRWLDVPKILETPKEKGEDGRDWDEVNLEVLRGLTK